MAEQEENLILCTNCTNMTRFKYRNKGENFITFFYFLIIIILLSFFFTLDLLFLIICGIHFQPTPYLNEVWDKKTWLSWIWLRCKMDWTFYFCCFCCVISFIYVWYVVGPRKGYAFFFLYFLVTSHYSLNTSWTNFIRHTLTYSLLSRRSDEGYLLKST